MSTVAKELQLLPTSGFKNIKLDEPVEEEELPGSLPNTRKAWTRCFVGDLASPGSKISRIMRPDVGPMLLTDFGEARIGPGPHAGNIMPLKLEDLLEPRGLFTPRDDDEYLYDTAHIAQLIAALEPLPPGFLARNGETRVDFWDEQDLDILFVFYTGLQNDGIAAYDRQGFLAQLFISYTTHSPQKID
ncbi:uncharacterized protein EURHEDRAFT_401077 [Aspergillus ruber CBS 135680]|uniref:Uncharacterized protein n=1 Tax=Aspergillus ruber (strain CBS 135680) TaxID=1388766 RepID=A0A017SK66_ASPRC|nr:uncharacterized protein EURHEDRAFT_401077 [Aspergillus ruber CBS 135680]EYE97337.1 hypothetical protein EURHEDRAFT_401077 [Aspergillus ruber CBS 135680]